MTVAGASLEVFETPQPVIEARLALSGRVAEERGRTEDVVCALVVGSTALRRCSRRADLDLVLVTPRDPEADRFESQVVEGVQVEIERMSEREALDRTAGEGWVWELRDAARLGSGIAVLDQADFAAELSRRAAAMVPRRDRFEAALRGVYLLLVESGQADDTRGMEALRGCFDNLALLALLERPRRYQKPKWALADLLHAGEESLVDAVLAAYGVESDHPTPAERAVAAVRDVVEGVYELAGLPSHEAILAMGYAPDLAEASYVSRCLDDAEDLLGSGRFLEAQYVAKFAARLAAGMATSATTGVGVVDAFAALGGPDLAARYLALFDDGRAPLDHLLAVALASADARRDGLAA